MYMGINCYGRRATDDRRHTLNLSYYMDGEFLYANVKNLYL